VGSGLKDVLQARTFILIAMLAVIALISVFSVLRERR
jgi:competence protein ComGC